MGKLRLAAMHGRAVGGGRFRSPGCQETGFEWLLDVLLVTPVIAGQGAPALAT